jgi:hypothetical protein
MDRYLELEAESNLNYTDFANKYIQEEELKEYTLMKLGFFPTTQISYTAEQLGQIQEVFLELESKEKVRSRLTNNQVSLLRNYFSKKLVDLKKSKIRFLLDRPELARIVVDSGEIKAKLELFMIQTNDTANTGNMTKVKMAQDTRMKDINSTSKFDFNSKLINESIGSITKELIDSSTGDKIIYIDKAALLNSSNTKALLIPNTRMIAKPISSANSANISSEVIIKFRSL